MCPASFDVVTCMEMLEHVPDLCPPVVRCMCNTGQTRRLGFFSTINRNPKSYALAIAAVGYVLEMLPGHIMSLANSSGPARWPRFAVSRFGVTH